MKCPSLFLLAVCLLAANIHAANFTWDGGAYVSGNESTRNWTLAGNWDPDGVPAAGQSGLLNISNKYAVANADLPGSPAIEVGTGGLVLQVHGVTLTTPLTLSGGTWSTGINVNYAWGPDRVLNAPLVVTAPSRMTGARVNVLWINGPVSGSGQLTFQGIDSGGTEWIFGAANNPFSGGMVIEAGNSPAVWAGASQALGTGDITVRNTGTLRMAASQNYAGAARTPVVYLDGGTIDTANGLNYATIPFNVVVQAKGGTLAGALPNGWGISNVYSGSVTLNGPLMLTATRCYDQNSFTVSGPITGNQPVTVYTTDEYGGARGAVVLSNAGNSFAGITLQNGYLRATREGALASGPITVHTGDDYTKLYLDKTPNANWTLTNNITAGGVIQVEDGSAGYTLNCSGSTVTIGTSGTAAGTMTVNGSLAFQKNGAAPATLKIDVIGSGSPAVVSNDLLVVSQNLGGLSNANLDVSISGLAVADLAGKSLTIATCLNDLTGQTFNAVTCPPGWKGAVTCGNGLVQLRLVAEGDERPVLDLSPKSLNYSIRVGEPNPAPTPVRVNNLCFGTSAWTAAVRAPAPSWISLADTTGSNGDSFTVSIDCQPLAVGMCTAYVDVTDAGATNSPQTLAVVLQVRPDADASTHSFTNTTRGTHPSTVVANVSGVTVNLSSLPAGTQIFRAILVPHINSSGLRSTTALRVQSADAPGVWLPAFGPRYTTLDCTAAAQRALLAGDKTLRLNVISWEQWYARGGSEVRLDVWCTAPISTSIQQVTHLAAMHRDGDTMLTFTEVNPPVTNSAPELTELQTATMTMDSPNEVRYRIYRSSQPIDAISVRTAELVDEIAPMSGWNWDITNTTIIPTLPVDDMTLSAVGTGIYVHRAPAAGNAYYAVSRAVNGQEDLTRWVPGVNNLPTAVAEVPGTGMALEWRQAGPGAFQYVDNAMRHYFVKWECPPDTWNTPSYAHNYLVAVPPLTVSPRPVFLMLHWWGGSLDSGFAWWLEAEQGALLVSTNEVPYDWWTAFHENTGTIKPWTAVDGNGGGVCRKYSQKRIWSFLKDYVMHRWAVDSDHILVGGGSMGGSGSAMWGIRDAEKFAYINSGVGVHIPRLTPTYAGSYAGVYGSPVWGCRYEDTGLSVWDYWDNDQWLRSHVSAETPFLTFANGKNDTGIGWQQAWMMAKACQETRRPHLFSWGQLGHGHKAYMPGTLSDRYITIDIDRTDTVPAFTYCSLDQNPGNGDPEVGDAEGMLNGYLLWQPKDSTDAPDRWEMTCLLIDVAPASTCTVDITPRRCRAFKPAVGKVCTWTNTDIATGTVIAGGTATVDANGLVTLPQLVVSKTKNRISITAPSLVGDINNDGYVNVGDLQALVAAWGSQAGPPPSANWNANADINKDSFVNVGDLQLFVAHWGEHY